MLDSFSIGIYRNNQKGFELESIIETVCEKPILSRIIKTGKSKLSQTQSNSAVC